MLRREFLVGVFLLLGIEGAFAQDYPTRTVKIVVPFAAGSSTDVVARIVANGLANIWGKPVIVDNRPGALGLTGTTSAVASPPDGEILIITSSATHSSNPWLFKTVPYDPKQFSHISELFEVPVLLLVNSKLPPTTEKEFAAYARSSATPVAHSYGSATQQVAAATYVTSTKFETIPVAYRSPPQAITDLVSGQVQFMFADPGLALPFIEDNRVRALAVAAPARMAILPDVPTFGELGNSALNFRVWIGISAPPGMDKALVAKINSDVRKVMAEPDTQDRLTKLGMVVRTNSPDEFARLVAEQLAIWGESIKAAGIKAE